MFAFRDADLGRTRVFPSLTYAVKQRTLNVRLSVRPGPHVAFSLNKPGTPISVVPRKPNELLEEARALSPKAFCSCMQSRRPYRPSAIANRRSGWWLSFKDLSCGPEPLVESQMPRTLYSHMLLLFYAS